MMPLFFTKSSPPSLISSPLLSPFCLFFFFYTQKIFLLSFLAQSMFGVIPCISKCTDISHCMVFCSPKWNCLTSICFIRVLSPFMRWFSEAKFIWLKQMGDKTLEWRLGPSFLSHCRRFLICALNISGNFHASHECSLESEGFFIYCQENLNKMRCCGWKCHFLSWVFDNQLKKNGGLNWLATSQWQSGTGCLHVSAEKAEFHSG